MIYTAKQNSLILDCLQAIYPDSSKTTLRSWIEQKRVFLEDELVLTTKQEVLEGQTITVGKKTLLIEDDVEILFEDQHLVVIHKPEGLLSVPTAFDKYHTAHNMLKKKHPGKVIYPVHRLDRETSGVMVFAYTSLAREHFKKLFYSHDIERKYIAIVENPLKQSQGTWQSYLVEDEATYHVASRKEPVSEAKLAITHYKTLATKKNCSLIELTLETGRKNQIRVHCAENGHPILGDKKYEAVTDPIQRLALHAESLGFVHPVTKKKMVFSKRIPASFQNFLK